MPKRKLLTLTNDQKYDICRYKRENPNSKLKIIARHFENKFELEPHALKIQTLSGIINRLHFKIS